MGYSVAGSYDLDALLADTGVFARVDIYDPARGTANDGLTRIIAGGTYDWSNSVKLVADYTAATYASAAAANAGQTLSMIGARAQINL